MHVRFAAFYFLHFALIGGFSPYFALYLHKADFAPQEVTILMSTLLAGRLLFPLLWGWAADMGLPRRWAVPLTLIGSIGGLLACLDSPGLLRAFCAILVFSFFWSGNLPLLEALVLDHLSARRDDYGRIRKWGSAGFLISVSLIGATVDVAGDGLVFACIGLACLLLGVSLTLPCQEEGSPLPRSCTPPSLLRTPRVRALLLIGFLMCLVHGAYNLLFSIYLSDHGYSTKIIGVLWALGALSEIVVLSFSAAIFQRCARRKLIALCFFAATVRFLLTAWGVSSPGLLVLAQLMHALSFGLCHAAIVGALADASATGRQNGVQAAYASACGAGALAGSLASGALWSLGGGGWAFTAAAIFAAASVPWLLRVRRLPVS
ncbi:MFS transporter [Rhodocyclus tenuis]|uniref:PPP family 3-phenylpropionic acid transporter n=1 Tax=Rhodocyclus tenuis TaxID=1066 RepID=A0A840G7Z9_RHOTE|nr:MFS transporter [Rhodocyclus tenuis]MBB4247996.1 PPP family 3-phenylpropionic acid transporter [Rhodocyclus tenuis]